MQMDGNGGRRVEGGCGVRHEEFHVCGKNLLFVHTECREDDKNSYLNRTIMVNDGE